MGHEWVIAAGLLVCLAARLPAATVHVAVNGDDGNPGSAEKPVRTVRKAIDLVLPEKEPSEIIIHEGIYPGDVQVGNHNDRLGGARPLLLIRAAKKPDGSFEDVVLDGGRKITKADPVPGKPGIYKVEGQFSYHRRTHMWEADTRTRYMLVADLAAVEQFPASFWHTNTEAYFHTSDNRPPSAHDMAMSRNQNGITLWRPNVTVRGLQFRNFLAWRYSAGVELRGADTAAEDCSVSNSVRGFQVMVSEISDAIGLTGTRFVRCRTDDCAGGVYSMGTGTVVEDCRFYKIRDGFMVPAYPQDDCGIQYYYPASGGEVRRNLVVGFGSGIFVKCKVSEFIVEHNTCLDGITYGIGCRSWGPKSVFRYNIATGFSRMILHPEILHPTNVVDYNCFWDSRETSALHECLEEPRRVGTGMHTIVADPLFANQAAGDYRLLPGSPCARMGPNGESAGAFGIVGPEFEDKRPPDVEVAVEPPASRVGGSGELYFEGDPWQGGGRNLVRTLPPEGRLDEWVSPTDEVTLKVTAQDVVSRPVRMKVRVGNAPGGEPEPFLRGQRVRGGRGGVRKSVKLPRTAGPTAVSVSVTDAAGNWSEPVSLMLRTATSAPRLKAGHVLYANANGVVISFETDVPCLAKVEFGADTTYGSVFEQPKNMRRSWIAADGGDWVEIRSKPRVTNFLALLPPRVTPGQTYHYRLVLEDEVGNRTVTDDASFTLQGAPASYWVSPEGTDEDGRGSREAPWRTLQFAVERALPGDRVVLLPGLYAGETTLSHGGLKDASITIEAERAGTVVLDGRRESEACLRLDKAPYVVIRGLELRWYKRAGVYIADSPHVTVEGCRIWNDFWMGWPVGSGIFAHRSPGVTADHNVIFQMEQGIYLLQSPHSRVTHNTILRNMYGAVKFVYSAEGTVSHNNSFCFSGNDQDLVAYQSEKELETFDSDYNNLATILGSPDPGDKIVPADPFLRTASSKAVIRLNGKRFNSLKAWQETTGKDRHTIFKDPLYVDPENWDFRLKPDSPNIGAGKDGATIGALGVAEQ